jgi:hypothetical protein
VTSSYDIAISGDLKDTDLGAGEGVDMARLIGAQRMVLQAILDLPKDAVGYVTDARIAQSTQITVSDVRDWIETLEGDGHVNVAKTESGLSASVTAQGKLLLKQFQPVGTTNTQTGPPGLNQPAPSTAPTRTILFLASNPRDTARLRLDQEARQIEAGLERARRRDQFKLVTKWAVTDSDLLRALLDHDPEVVHFSGHGGGEEGLKFDDGSGQTHLIPGDALARLFSLCSDHVKCVVLNACYAETQAEAIVRHIDYVIGMSKDIGDEASVRFSVGFYDALGAGRSFEKAFEFGKVAIDLRGIPEYQTPVLKKKL